MMIVYNDVGHNVQRARAKQTTSLLILVGIGMLTLFPLATYTSASTASPYTLTTTYTQDRLAKLCSSMKIMNVGQLLGASAITVTMSQVLLANPLAVTFTFTDPKVSILAVYNADLYASNNGQMVLTTHSTVWGFAARGKMTYSVAINGTSCTGPTPTSSAYPLAMATSTTSTAIAAAASYLLNAIRMDSIQYKSLSKLKPGQSNTSKEAVFKRWGNSITNTSKSRYG